MLLSAGSYYPNDFFPSWFSSAYEKAEITMSASVIKMSRMADNLSGSVKTFLS